MSEGYRLSSEEEKQLLQHLFEGRDARESYRLTWPAERGAGPPVTLPAFLRLYADLLVRYLSEAGRSMRSALSEDEQRGAEQTTEIRNGLHASFMEVLEMAPPEDDPYGKYHVLAKLASAHDRMRASADRQKKRSLDEMSAVHNLLCANSEHED